MTRTRSLASVALLGLAALMPARAQEDVAPDQLVKTVTLEVVELIAKDKEIQSGNRAKLIELIDAKVLPHFNFSAMTALAVQPNPGTSATISGGAVTSPTVMDGPGTASANPLSRTHAAEIRLESAACSQVSKRLTEIVVPSPASIR